MDCQSQAITERRPRLWGMTLLLFFAALALNLAGNGRISLWDRDEPRFAQAARQMLESGDWVVPKFNQDNRYDKPVLIYWLMDGAMKLFGVNEFSARFPAALAGAATVALVFGLALGMGCATGPAALAAVMTMTGALTLGVAKSATTDGVLTLTVVAMMALLWRQRRRGFSWTRHLLLYAVLGASVILKGPPGLLVLATAVAGEWLWSARLERRGLTLPRRVQWLRWAAGLAVFFAVALPWAILAWQRTHGEFFSVAIGKHVVGRSLSAMESHGGKGFLYFLFLPAYVPVLALGVFPWSAPALLGLRRAWLRRNEPARRFLWCWLAPAFAVFSLAATKLPHYIAPLLPAVALMSALWLQDRKDSTAAVDQPGAAWWRAGALLTAVLGAAAALGLLGMAVYLKFTPLIAPAVLAAAVAASGCAWGARQWLRRRVSPALVAWGAAMAAAILIVFLWALPAIEPLKPSKALTAWVKANAPANTELLAADYREPTLVFYWGAPVTMLGNSEQDDALARLRDRARPAALITTSERWRKWTGRQPQLGAVASVKTSRRCFTFQRGKWGEMVVVGNW